MATYPPAVLSDVTKALSTKSTATTTVDPPRPANESQYSKDAVYSYIAYKNQDPNTDSDLHTARRKFEHKYQLFLMRVGQYSNAALPKPTPTGYADTIKYPILNDTDIFKSFEWKKPSIPND
jgi:hypothetical protein